MAILKNKGAKVTPTPGIFEKSTPKSRQRQEFSKSSRQSHADARRFRKVHAKVTPTPGVIEKFTPKSRQRQTFVKTPYQSHGGARQIEGELFPIIDHIHFLMKISWKVQ